MLPYFNILVPNDDNNRGDKKNVMYSGEVPVKPRRKKHHQQEVPIVHQSKSIKTANDPQQQKRYKTYGANFGGKKWTKTKDIDGSIDGRGDEEDDEKMQIKVSKRTLTKETERLARENEELKIKLAASEDRFYKKSEKLKERFAALTQHNERVADENAELKRLADVLRGELANCKQCDEYRETLDRRAKELEIAGRTNKDYAEDVDMLKNVVYRLNVQLERYQEKLRKCNVVRHEQFVASEIQLPELCENVPMVDSDHLTAAEHRGHSHAPATWGKVNVHTLGPLLDAYQDALDEKDYIIGLYQNEMTRFGGRMKEIVRENERLHKRLNEDKDCSKVIGADLAKIKEELRETREENDLLVKRCAIKQDKLDEVLNCYEQKVEQIQRDYNVLYEQYCKIKTESTMLKDKNKALNETFEEIKSERQQYIPIALHNSSVNECKRWYDELKNQYEMEKTKLMDTVQSLNNKITDLTSRMTSANAEKQELENKLRGSEKSIKKVEIKYADLQRTLQEVQLSRTACKKQLSKALSFAKDLVTEQETLLKALNQRQQETKAVKRIGSDIVDRMEALKLQLKTVQKDAWQELSFVEQRMREQNEFIAKLKEDHSEEIEKFKVMLNQRDQTNLYLSGNASVPVSPYLLFRDKQLKI